MPGQQPGLVQGVDAIKEGYTAAAPALPALQT